jgi:hypothetical protein
MHATHMHITTAMISNKSSPQASKVGQTTARQGKAEQHNVSHVLSTCVTALRCHPPGHIGLQHLNLLSLCSVPKPTRGIKRGTHSAFSYPATDHVATTAVHFSLVQYSRNQLSLAVCEGTCIFFLCNKTSSLFVMGQPAVVYVRAPNSQASPLNHLQKEGTNENDASSPPAVKALSYFRISWQGFPKQDRA